MIGFVKRSHGNASNLNFFFHAIAISTRLKKVHGLAKSFSKDTDIRFNSVNAGPLKTSASAGIPGYLVNYLYAEKLTFRKKALATQEVANLATFLLSPRSSGINGQGIVIDGGMGLNYFDQEIVNSSMRINE